MNIKFIKYNAISKIKSGLVLDLIRSFFARGLAAFGSVVLMMILGRLYGAAGVGVFALAQSILLGIATLSRFGMDGALMRFVGRDKTTTGIYYYFWWAVKKSLVVSMFMAAALLMLRETIELFFGANGIEPILLAFAIATPGFTLSFLVSGFMKGIGKPASACLLENGGVSLVASVLVLVFYWGGAGELWFAGLAFAVSSYIVFFMGLLQLYLWSRCHKLHRDEKGYCYLKKPFFDSSINFFYLNCASMIQTVISVWIVGYFVSSSELGLFRVALQLAMLIHFIQIVVDSIFPPRFAALFYQGELKKLNTLARQGALIGMILALPLMIFFLLYPEPLLLLFGEEFAAAVLLLKILAVGQFINVASGSVTHLLSMTGNERLIKNVALLSSVMGIALLLVLIPYMGVVGAALAYSFSLILQNLVALVCVWFRLGIWMLPVPNIFRIFGMPGERP